MEYSLFNTEKIFCWIIIIIIILLLVNLILKINKVLFKQNFSKNLQEKQISIIFASEKERDAVLALIEKDKQETKELEEQAKNFCLK